MVTFKWKNRLQECFDSKTFQQSQCPIIFSRDVKNNTSIDKIVKNFDVIPFDKNECKNILKADMHLYEVIYNELPRKFYVDIDLDHEHFLYDRVQVDDMITTVHQFISFVMNKEKGCIHQSHQIDDSIRFVSFVSNDFTSKKSVHLIYPQLVFRDVDELLLFRSILNFHIQFSLDEAKFTSTQIDIIKKTMDMSVYSRNRSFRLPGQTKMGKSTYLKPKSMVRTVDMFVGIYCPRDKIKYTFDRTMLQQRNQTCVESIAAFAKNIAQSHFPKQNRELMSSHISSHIELFQQLKTYDKYNFPDASQVDDEIQFYLYCIPNSSKEPQSYDLWWRIGQALKNISSDCGDSNGTEVENPYLHSWIEWSRKAEPTYKNEVAACVDMWTSLRIRTDDQPKYSMHFLKMIAIYYVGEDLVHSFCERNDIVWFFDILRNKSKLDCVFDGIETYKNNYASDKQTLLYQHYKSVVPPTTKSNPENPSTNHEHVQTQSNTETLSTNHADVQTKSNTVQPSAEPQIHRVVPKQAQDKSPVYCREYDFEKYDVIVSQAPMGAGKTYQIKRSMMMNDFQRILVMSPRQTFGKEKVHEYREIYEDFMHYKDEDMGEVESLASVDKLVVQVESLRRLASSRKRLAYDLVVLDEIESILYQFSSDTHKDVQSCFKVFFDIVMNSKKIIIADAFVTNRTVYLCQFLKKWRQNTRIKLDINLWNPNEGKKAHILGIADSGSEVKTVKDKFLKSLCESIQKGNKVCVVCGSRDFKNRIIQSLKENKLLTREQILDYDCFTSDENVDALQQVNKLWGDENIRIVIYTTKITIGINFDLKDVFDHIYIYGSRQCPVIRDLMQSHFRVRHTMHNAVFIALNNFAYNPPVLQKLDELEKYQSRVHGFFQATNCKTSLDQKEVLFQKIHLFNIFEENMGSQSYGDLFRYFLQDKVGYTIIDDPRIIICEKEENDLDKINYPINYIDLRDTAICDGPEMQHRQLKGCATTLDKRALHVLTFYEDIIQAGDLHFSNDEIDDIWERFQNMQHSEQHTAKHSRIMRQYDFFLNRKNISQSDNVSTVETHLFYLYDARICPDVLRNIVMEIKHFRQPLDIVRAHYTASSMKHQQYVVRYHLVRQLCELLGVRYSFDEDARIPAEKINGLYSFIKENQLLIKGNFNIRIRIKNPNPQQECVTIISQMLEQWNMCKFKPAEQKRTAKELHNLSYKIVRNFSYVHVDMVLEKAKTILAQKTT